ncbi:MAG TPA: hypothetical protein VH917_07385 [Ignavibacteriaceae bacterium]
MKKIFLILLLVTGLAAIAFPQNLNGRFSSSVYSFERIDTAEVSTNHLRTFQMLTLNFGKQNIWLRSYLNLETDIAEDLVYDPRLRFYNLYLDVNNLWDIVFVKLGRQPLFNSIGGGVFDGGTLGFDYKGFRVLGYYGGNVPAYQKLEFTDDLSNDYVAGGELTVNALTDWRFAAKYINKNFLNPAYNTVRLDPDLNPIDVLIENNSNKYEFASAEISYSKPKLLRIDSRYQYDMTFETTSKVELSGRYEQVENLGVNLYYNYREPRIRYNSIFSVFDFGNTWEIEGGLDYRIQNKYTISGKFANVSFKDESSQRVTIGLNSPIGGITVRRNFGYAGELDVVSLYGAHTFLEGLITPNFGFSFTRYKQTESAPVNELVSLMAGTNIRPWRTFSVDLQGQYLNNKIYSNDLRLFLKLNYWFNTNFNM